MKVYRGTVADVADLTKSGSFKVNLPTPLAPVHVTYMSPMNNLDGGIFAPPTVNSEVLVLHLEVNETEGDAAGYYYLGAVVGSTKSYAGPPSNQSSTPTAEQLAKNPNSAESIKPVGGKIDLRSLGLDAASPPTTPLPIADRIYANQVTPDIMAFLDKGGNGLILYDMIVGGRGPSDAYMNVRTRLQTGTGKRIDLVDTAAMDYIKISTGKGDGGGGEDYVLLGGKQTGMGAESNTVQAGEFKVDSHGPSNITSRDRGIELRAKGLNIDIVNEADGFFAPDSDGRYVIFPGGQDPYWPLEDDPEFPDAAPLYPPLPKPSIVSAPTGNAHLFGKGGKPGGKPDGGNPLDKGNEKYGNVNIRSEWNNINIEGRGPDSVIHLNAPYYEGKIVITTGGTVDIIATQKVSITSGESIELNAPYIDINSGIRTDID